MWLIRIELFNHFNNLFSCYRKNKKTKNFSREKSWRSKSSAPRGYIEWMRKWKEKVDGNLWPNEWAKNGSMYTFPTSNWWLMFLFSLLLLPFFSCVTFSTSFGFLHFEVQLMRCIYLIVCALSHRYTVIDIIFKTDYVKMFSFVQQNKKNDCDAYVYAKLSNCRVVSCLILKVGKVLECELESFITRFLRMSPLLGDWWPTKMCFYFNSIFYFSFRYFFFLVMVKLHFNCVGTHFAFMILASLCHQMNFINEFFSSARIQKTTTTQKKNRSEENTKSCVKDVHTWRSENENVMTFIWRLKSISFIQRLTMR